MNQQLIDKLLLDLKNTDPIVRARATNQLWRIWFWQKGQMGIEQIELAEQLFSQGDFTAAETVLTELIDFLPDFAEAWNRRAVLYFINKKYPQSIADCNEVIKLNPWHFGALHGLGLSHMTLGNYRSAITAFNAAMSIQPYAVENQRLILECTIKLT
jgi:tetratricopeptide (TPR) repeat protein